MKTIKSRCEVCHSKLEDLFTFKDFPVYVGVADVNEEILKNDLIFNICSSCGTIQLKELMPYETLYSKPHHFSIGKSWKEHNDSFTNFVAWNTKDDKTFYEIGGENLALAKPLTEIRTFKDYVIKDVRCSFDTKKYRFVKNDPKNKFDYIALAHTLEHIYMPLDFLIRIKRHLKKKGKIFIAGPLLQKQLEDKLNNHLSFEHTFLTSEKIYSYLFQKAGLSIESIHYHGKYNIFYCLKHAKKDHYIEKHNFFFGEYEKNKKLFQQWESKLRQSASISKTFKEDPFYIFGAHITTQLLLKSGLDETKVISILDNEKTKWNKKLYGFNIRVESPDVLKGRLFPDILLNTGQYDEEVKKQILEINNTARFL